MPPALRQSNNMLIRQMARALTPQRDARGGERYGVPGQGGSGAISALAVAALLLAWWTTAELKLVPPLFLPHPFSVLDKFFVVAFESVSGSDLLGHTMASVTRILGAFVLACLTGIPIGLAMGVNRLARGVLDPPIEFYRPIPPLAYLPLIIIWFGIGEVSKVVLIYLAVFAPIAMNARAGVRSVSVDRIHAAYSLGASRAQVFWQVILRGALPEILTGMRIGIGFGWTTLVAAEMVAATVGLGHMVLDASNFLVTDVVVMGIVVIGMIAYTLDLLMRRLEAALVPWKGKM